MVDCDSLFKKHVGGENYVQGNLLERKSVNPEYL